jgi:hypothetical protein
MADWVLVAVEVNGVWTESEMKVQFRNRELILRPGEGDRYPDVSILRNPGESYEEAATLIHRFLSALCWIRRYSLVTVGHGGGSHRFRIGGRPAKLSHGWISSVTQPPQFTIGYLPQILTPEGEQALALYREALGLNHETFQFLGFFKIVNIRYATGKDQIGWINSMIPTIKPPTAQRVQDLQRSHANVGEYLYVQGRCALAHANAPPTVDPDRFDHIVQFNQDLPVVRELAEHFIEVELGISR